MFELCPTGTVGAARSSTETRVTLKERCSSCKIYIKNRHHNLRDAMAETMRVGNEAAKLRGVWNMNPCVHHGYELLFYPEGHQEPLKGFKKESGVIRVALK